MGEYPRALGWLNVDTGVLGFRRSNVAMVVCWPLTEQYMVYGFEVDQQHDHTGASSLYLHEERDLIHDLVLTLKPSISDRHIFHFTTQRPVALPTMSL